MAEKVAMDKAWAQAARRCRLSPADVRMRRSSASAREMTWERWLAFGRDAAAMQRLEKSLTTYYSLVNGHTRDYYQHLDPARRVELEPWFLPEVPRRFIDKCVPWEANKRASEQRRKARTDALGPLAITLIAIALERRKPRSDSSPGSGLRSLAPRPAGWPLARCWFSTTPS
jgi:hypothetical protein